MSKTVEKIMDLGIKYKMSDSDKNLLEIILIIGIKAVQKCIDLGVSDEVMREIIDFFN